MRAHDRSATERDDAAQAELPGAGAGTEHGSGWSVTMLGIVATLVAGGAAFLVGGWRRR